MTTLKRIYDLLINTTRIVNKTAKKINYNKDRKNDLYKIKNNSILEAVKIILETKTQAVRFELNFDEEKNMNYITFIFKKEKYIKFEIISFHLTPSTYNKIKNLHETM